MKLLFSFLFITAAILLETRLSTNAADSVNEPFEIVRGDKHVKVWYYSPERLSANAPIIMVMHGVNRDASRYLSEWMPLAKANHFLVVVPEFSQAEFPGSEGYIYGNTVDRTGHPLPAEQWAFSFIEPVFDAVCSRTSNKSATYGIYGHSAGAQFVQRFLYFVPSSRVSRAVAANAGWYMLPDLTISFPYGLKGTPVTDADLRNALNRPLLVLLGTADTDSDAKELRKTAEAEAQGNCRLTRGKYFFNYGKKTSAAMGTSFAWSEGHAPGVAHSDAGMAPYSLHWLLQSGSGSVR